MEDCAFCRLISGERDAFFLYEDDETASFFDRNPAIQGHSLVVPKTHLQNLFTEHNDSIPQAVFQTVQRLAMAMSDALEPDGLSLFYTSAELVGQVKHAHVHLIPRFNDDHIHLALVREPFNETEAEQLADQIRDRL